MTQSNITLALSILGSLTGSIGLWLQFKKHRLDKAQLINKASFGFESPKHNNHLITIRSVGRRPVTIDSIKYFILPHKKWYTIFKNWHHRKGKWLWNQDHRELKIKLSEGEKTQVKISLPKGIEIQYIYKVTVIDQSGKQWPVKWPSHCRLSKIATMQQMDSFETKNETRTCSITGFRLGEKYYLETKFKITSKKTGPSGRSFWFRDMKSYREKYEDVKEKQIPQFLAAEVEEII